MNIDQKDFLLSANRFEIPEAIYECRGIQIGSKSIRSILLSTDLSFVENITADSIMAVHPFEKSGKMDKVLIDYCQKPVFSDIGGGLMNQHKTIEAALKASKAGAAGLVISKPTPPEVISEVRSKVDNLLIYTVIFNEEPIEQLYDAGVDIFNVATGEFTAESVFSIKNRVPNIHIMASGGPYNSTIRETIQAGAEAIVFNPPTATEMMRSVFDDFRNGNG